MSKQSAIDMWLEEHNARKLTVYGDREVGLITHTMALYAINGKLLVVQRFAEGSGWDVFIPACAANDTGLTLAALDAWVASATVGG